MTKTIMASAIVAIFAVACAAEDAGSLTGTGGATNDPAAPDNQNGGGATTPESTPGADPTQPNSCKEGVPHVGLGKNNFVSDRKPGAIGVDRRRVKPFSAMASEFQRALGNVPPAMAQSAAAYGDVPARWYAEPTAGAVSLYTTYGLAFTACYDSMTDAAFTAVPTTETATAECAKLQRKIWQRTATPEETKGCADLAVGLSTETVARRRWAHACASIMTSAGFTTY